MIDNKGTWSPQTGYWCGNREGERSKPRHEAILLVEAYGGVGDMAILERKRHFGKRGNPGRNTRNDIYIPHKNWIIMQIGNVPYYYQTSKNSCNQSRTQTK